MVKFTERNTNLARDLRNNPTPAEKKLWPYLSARKMAGVRFNRQVCIGPYICDFAARTVQLIIELDGDSHAQQVNYDLQRTRFLEAKGYRIIRFTNSEVIHNLEGVVIEIERILREMHDLDRPSPNPSRKREGRIGQRPSSKHEGG